MSAKQAINDKLHGSLATYWRCGGVVKNEIRTGSLLGLRMKKSLKSVNIWQSYKRERDCLVHFLRLLVVLARRSKSMRQPRSCPNCLGSVVSVSHVAPPRRRSPPCARHCAHYKLTYRYVCITRIWVLVLLQFMVLKYRLSPLSWRRMVDSLHTRCLSCRSRSAASIISESRVSVAAALQYQLIGIATVRSLCITIFIFRILVVLRLVGVFVLHRTLHVAMWRRCDSLIGRKWSSVAWCPAPLTICIDNRP